VLHEQDQISKISVHCGAGERKVHDIIINKCRIIPESSLHCFFLFRKSEFKFLCLKTGYFY